MWMINKQGDVGAVSIDPSRMFTQLYYERWVGEIRRRENEF